MLNNLSFLVDIIITWFSHKKNDFNSSFVGTTKHTIQDSVVMENTESGLLYNMVPTGLQNAMSKTHPYRYHIYMDRCLVTSNEASDIDKYAVSATLQHGSIFEMDNCKISDNTMQGGIALRLERVTQTNTPMVHRILNNEFTYNKQGNGIVDVQSNTGNPDDTVQIYGNLIMHNSPQDTESVIGVSETYLNMEYNTVYNNTGGRTLQVEQLEIPYANQQCIDNMFAYNLGHNINEKYTIELGATGVHFHSNVIQNPANEFEISALQSSGVINATLNWWGMTSAELIEKSLRDSDYVIGNPDIIFEPFLNGPPATVQNSKSFLKLT